MTLTYFNGPIQPNIYFSATLASPQAHTWILLSISESMSQFQEVSQCNQSVSPCKTVDLILSPSHDHLFVPNFTNQLHISTCSIFLTMAYLSDLNLPLHIKLAYISVRNRQPLYINSFFIGNTDPICFTFAYFCEHYLLLTLRKMLFSATYHI